MLELSDPVLDGVFRALANPSRRAMLARLTAGSASLSDLAAPLDMTLSAVEQHFKVLERCDLVRSDKVGRVRTCRLQADTVRETENWLGVLRADWERHLDRLGDFLDQTADTAEEENR
ncbi:ArsR/SmtB family transcription factor [Ilumatobacter sp.]|uniref:ArsR/SmtB family transcription factor n=1 Tax=Ilumatobacter sp. TaxID=1967498 RepID=UPI003C3E8EAD